MSLKNQVKTLIQRQQWTKAKTAGEQLCNANSGDPEAWFLLGTVCGQLSVFDEAVRCFRRATELRPDMPFAHFNLGLALYRQGRFDEAIGCFSETLRLYPGLPAAHKELGAALHQSGKLDSAIEHYRKALALNQAFTDVHYNLGVALSDAGHGQDAIRCFQEVLRLHPTHADALAQLGGLLVAHGHYSEAIRCYRKVVELRPKDAQSWSALSRALLDRGGSQQDSTEAEQCFRQALRHCPDVPQLYFNFGVMLREHGRREEAMENFRRALDLKPGHPETLAGMAQLLEQKGEYEAAHNLLRPLVEAEPCHPVAALAFATLARHVERRADAISLLDRLLQQPAAVPQRRSMHFALGKLYDENRKYDLAFEQYRQAHALETARFDEKHSEHIFESLMQVFCAGNFARLPRATHGSRLPVFIVGMPRSGTSLVEQILASHPQVFGAGELTDIPHIVQTLPESLGSRESYPECVIGAGREKLDEIAQLYLSVLRGLTADAARVTDKMPHNFLALGLIELLFPDACVIHCLRDPIDNCLSIYGLPFNAGHAYTAELASLGMYYRQYLRLMAHWRKVLSIPMLDVRYEELVGDQENVSRRIVEHCGLEWDERCLRFHETRRTVATPSYDQVRRPIYRQSVARWKNYEKHLGPLIKALGDAVTTTICEGS